MNIVSQRPFEVEIPLPVRTYDIDFAGIVNNIVYVRWLEDLRLEMLARHFPLNEQVENNIAPVLLQTKIDYKQSIKLSDTPMGKMWMKSLEPLRWTVNATIGVNEQVAAIGEQVGIFVNLQTNKPIRIPKVLKQKYSKVFS
ncbi:acyl-CoA thioesterase [Egbenema bharatensis]|uniref:acyl-CoA thioesterase n=1 Tax=Egbenema bharatensis TaxID=3463334 RepID=UPI003A8BD630